MLAFPRLSLAEWVRLILPALALTVVTMGEGLLLARSFADKYGYQTSRTATWLRSASRTHLRAVVVVHHGIVDVAGGRDGPGRHPQPAAVAGDGGGTLLLLLFGTGLLSDIPSPAIGAIVAVAVLVDQRRRVPAPVAAVPVRVRRRCNMFRRCAVHRPLAGIVLAFILSLINPLYRPPPAVDVLQA